MSRTVVVIAFVLGLASPIMAQQPGVTFGALATAQTVMSGDTDPAVVPGIYPGCDLYCDEPNAGKRVCQ